jgi:hypothetical protein
MISARTRTTTITPVITPALKIPSINLQLVNVVVRNTIIASGKNLLVIISFLFLLLNKILQQWF